MGINLPWFIFTKQHSPILNHIGFYSARRYKRPKSSWAGSELANSAHRGPVALVGPHTLLFGTARIPPLDLFFLL